MLLTSAVSALAPWLAMGAGTAVVSQGGVAASQRGAVGVPGDAFDRTPVPATPATSPGQPDSFCHRPVVDAHEVGVRYPRFPEVEPYRSGRRILIPVYYDVFVTFPKDYPAPRDMGVLATWQEAIFGQGVLGDSGSVITDEGIFLAPRPVAHVLDNQSWFARVTKPARLDDTSGFWIRVTQNPHITHDIRASQDFRFEFPEGILRIEDFSLSFAGEGLTASLGYPLYFPKKEIRRAQEFAIHVEGFGSLKTVGEFLRRLNFLGDLALTTHQIRHGISAFFASPDGYFRVIVAPTGGGRYSLDVIPNSSAYFPERQMEIDLREHGYLSDDLPDERVEDIVLAATKRRLQYAALIQFLYDLRGDEAPPFDLGLAAYYGSMP